MLPPRHRLRRSADLRRVREQGRRWHHPLVTLLVYTHPLSESPTTPSRFAFLAGRHVGGAVQRNLAKRRMREAVRQTLPCVSPGFDCLVIARPAAVHTPYEQLQLGIETLLARAGLCRKSGEVKARQGDPI